MAEGGGDPGDGAPVEPQGTVDWARRDRATVLFVDGSIGFGGTLVVLARLTTAMDRNRFRPIVLTAMDPTSLPGLFPPDVEVRRLRQPLDYVKRARAASITRRFDSRWIDRLTGYALTLVQWITDIPYILRLLGIFFRERVAVVHVNNVRKAVLIARLAGRPCLWHFHGIAGPAPWIKPHLILSPSQHMKSELLKAGYPEGLIRVMGNPIAGQVRTISDQERDELRSRAGAEDGEYLVGIVGRLVGWKGHMELFRATEELVLQGLPVKLAVIGGDTEGFGGSVPALHAFVEERGLGSVIRFMGHQRDVHGWLQAMDVTVHASTQPEPFGLVTTEAMQNGRPVIASVHGAGPELVQHGQTGLLVDPLEEGALAQAIKRFLEDPELREELAARGREWVESQLGPEAFARRVEGYYEELMGR